MKNLNLFLFFSLVTLNIYAQVNVGKSKSSINIYVSDLSDETFNNLQKGTTCIIIPDELDADKYTEMIESVWTFNEYKFISEDEYKNNWDNIVSENISVLKLVDRVWNKVKRNFVDRDKILSEHIEFSFKLYFYENIRKTKKGKIEYDAYNVAEIFFTPNIRLRRDVVHASGRIMFPPSPKKLNKKNPEEPGFYNFDLGYIKNYFQALNAQLLKKENLKMRDGIEKKEKIRELKNKTLFAPDWILRRYDAMKAVYKKTIEAGELFKKYDYKYSVIKNEELNSKILSGEQFYYLMHTQFNQVKIISVIDSLTGEIIYLTEENSYNAKDSDIKKINNLIK